MGKNWNEEEDRILIDLVQAHGKQWGVIAQKMGTRTSSQVAARWEKCLDPKLTKGPFTPEEDAIITEYVSKNGPQNWPGLSQLMKNRSPKQCRERWFNHLDPSISSLPWSPEEDAMIFDYALKYGNKWSIISKFIPGRTDNAIKNRWNSSISKRIRIDPAGRKFLSPDFSRCQKSLIPQQPMKQNLPIGHPPFTLQPPSISPMSSSNFSQGANEQHYATIITEQSYPNLQVPFSNQDTPSKFVDDKNRPIMTSSFPYSIHTNPHHQLNLSNIEQCDQQVISTATLMPSNSFQPTELNHQPIQFKSPFSSSRPIPHFKREAAEMKLQPVITSCPLNATTPISEQQLITAPMGNNPNLRIVNSINTNDNNIFPQHQLQEPPNSPVQLQQSSPFFSLTPFSPTSPLFTFSPNGSSGSFPFGSSGAVTPTYTPNGQDNNNNRNVFK